MNNEAVDVSSIRAMVMEDFYKNSEQRLQEQQKKITRLEENLAQYKEYDTMGRTLVPELRCFILLSLRFLSLTRWKHG